MKYTRTISLFVILLLSGVSLSAQTVDEVVNKYLKAIGGKETISKINSLYVESKMSAMGMEGPIKITTLNGKGYKQEIEIMGAKIVSCFTDQGGWSINPMMGSGTAEAMPEAQYLAGKDQIVIGAPFVNYKESGYQAEITGNETVGDVEAVKIKMTSPANISATYYFDPSTGYLVKAIQPGDMGETVATYSDYRQVEGYAMPFKVENNIGGGQFVMTMTINTVEVNKAVDESIFQKP